MVRTKNKFVLFGGIAAVALVVPGLLGPLALQDAYAQEQSNEATNRAENALVQANVQANANVDVDVNDVTACVIVDECQDR